MFLKFSSAVALSMAGCSLAMVRSRESDIGGVRVRLKSTPPLAPPRSTSGPLLLSLRTCLSTRAEEPNTTMMRDMVTGQGCMPDDSEAARNPMANMMNAMA